MKRCKPRAQGALRADDRRGAAADSNRDRRPAGQHRLDRTKRWAGASLAALAGCAALFSTPASHGQVTRSTSGSASVRVGSDLYVQDPYAFSDQALPLDKAAAAAVGGTQGSATAHVQPGLVQARSTAQASSSGSRLPGEAYAATSGGGGSFLDSLTATGNMPGGAAASGSGYLYGSIEVSGFLNAVAGPSSSAAASLTYTLAVPGSTAEHYVSDWSGRAVVYSLSGGFLRRTDSDIVQGVPTFNSGRSFVHAASAVEHISELVAVRVPLVFGVASNFSFLGGAGSSASISNPDVGTSASAQADFGHTFQWLGTSKVTFVDARGIERPLASFDIHSASGVDYLGAVVPVPEPDAGLLLLLGLPLVFARSVRRGRRTLGRASVA